MRRVMKRAGLWGRSVVANVVVELRSVKFWTTILATLAVTVLGVFFAIRWDSRLQERRSDLRVQAKLCMVYLESKQNALVIIETQDLLTDYAAETSSVLFRRPSTAAVLNALADPYLLDRISFEEANLLRLYLHSMDVLARILDTAQQLIIANRSEALNTDDFLATFRGSIADAFAYTRTTQDRLAPFKDVYEAGREDELVSLEALLESYRQKALSNRIRDSDAVD